MAKREVSGMRKLSDKQWQSLAAALRRQIPRVAPEWTDHNSHDPGITVLEVLAYALTDLHHRSSALDARGRALAQQIAQLAGSLAAGAGAEECPTGMQRVNFFSGQMLSADDFTTEQDYIRGKFRRLNRMLHGAGLVSGLEVKVEASGGGARIVITPGFAISPTGDEIEVCAPASLLLPATGTSLLVLLHYAEQPCRPVPKLTTEGDAPTVFSRITETCSVTLAPTVDDAAVALARVKFSRGRWMLDRKFKAPKVSD
jgi:hypothetical protein